jgi:hypothetical protein
MDVYRKGAKGHPKMYRFFTCQYFRNPKPKSLCGAFIPVGGRDSSYESESADILCSAHPPCRTLSPRLLILRQRPTLFLGSPCGTFAQSCFSLHYRNLSFVVKQRSLEKLWANTSYQP